ncbi:MAG: dTDP-4-dehydrorhamnose reductase [Leptolyngbyaceae cyanobacterium SM2_5_2]|nr:dTDP-4-dehydrorhamnose reductase [Leptolyngbyaceae cyanobacterium SM2_5_2]
MKVLLVGVTGQIGHEIKHELSSIATVVAPGRDQMDLSHPQAIAAQVKATAPDIIINAAAYTAVDQSEAEVTVAQRINGLAPGHLAAAANQVSAALIHLSTDYVFDGNQSFPYRESDPPAPVSMYGQSKLAGEQAIQTHCDRHLILRTAWVYGTYGSGNFVKTMLTLGGQRDVVRVVYDQVGTPTWAREVAKVVATLAQRLDTIPWGIYHFTNSGVASWYDFAIAIFEEAEALGYPLKMQRVEPITTPEYPTPAHRPAYSVLANEKIIDVLGYRPPHWRRSLRAMLAEYVPLMVEAGEKFG